jgi:hypothetical protein
VSATGRQTAHRTSRAPAIATLAIGAVLLALIVLAQTAFGERVLHRAGLFDRSEPYTELFFDDPQALAPLTQSPQSGTVRTSLAFTIGNETHHTMLYSWEIRIAGRLSASGSARIRSGRAQVIRQIATVQCGSAPNRKGTPPSGAPVQTAVRVLLQRPHESIDYLVNCHG